jgi:hypothetical protein
MMNNDVPLRPRYTSRPLPPYSFVPGHAPHPIRDPRGHMYGRELFEPSSLNPELWQRSEAYLYGVDLFNYGFYWEAHEAWESLWAGCGRRGTTADWLKTLIKLAAALVKFREGNAPGAYRHARRSLELLDDLREELPDRCTTYCGVNLHELERAVRDTLEAAEVGSVKPRPRTIYKHWLALAFDEPAAPSQDGSAT